MEQNNSIHLIPTSKIKIKKIKRRLSKNNKSPLVENKEEIETPTIEQRIEKIGELLSKTDQFYIPQSNTRKKFKPTIENK